MRSILRVQSKAVMYSKLILKGQPIDLFFLKTKIKKQIRVCRYMLKMDYNENSHIKLTIEPCLCCVQVTIYCCGHVFLFIILLQFDRKN